LRLGFANQFAGDNWKARVSSEPPNESMSAGKQSHGPSPYQRFNSPPGSGPNKSSSDTLILSFSAPNPLGDDARRRLWRWHLASVDRRCAQRAGEIRPGRRNGLQPNQETFLQLWLRHLAELDAHNSISLCVSLPANRRFYGESARRLGEGLAEGYGLI
jgi:hypothetical protein